MRIVMATDGPRLGAEALGERPLGGVETAFALLGAAFARRGHEVDRDISDMLRRLDRYSSAKAADLLAQGKIGSLPDNVRRCLSRIFLCYVRRKGYREGGWGLLIAICAGLFPLLSHLKARLEPERYRPAPPR